MSTQPVPPNATDPGAALVGALTAIQDQLKTQGEQIKALAAPAPVVTQTNEQAIQSFINESREQHAALKGEAEKQAGVVAKLQAALEERDAELKKVRETVDLRVNPTYSLGELTERLSDQLGGNSVVTKGIYGRLGTMHASKSERWKEQFPSMTPVDVLMCGGHEVKTVIVKAGGLSIPLTTMVPMFAEDAVLREAQDRSDEVYLWTIYRQMKGQRWNSINECPFYPAYRQSMEALGKAMNDTTLANWVPTGFSAQLMQRVELERNLVRFFTAVQMPQNPYRMSVAGARVTVRRVIATSSDPESATKITSSALNAAKCELTLHQFAIRGVFDIEAEEDAVPTLIPELREEMARSWGYTEEDIALNSDGTNTFHVDVDVIGSLTTSTDPRRTVDGLRPLAINNSYTTSLASAHDAEGITGLVGSLGVYGARPGDTVFVAGPKERAALLVMKTNAGHPAVVGSANPMNPSAFLQNGEIQTLLGSPLVISEAMRENVNASGFYDGTTTSNRTLLVFNRKAFAWGFRNEAPTIKTNFETSTAQNEILLYVRREFEDIFAIASNTSVWMGRAIT